MTLEIGVDSTFAQSVGDRLMSIEDRLGASAFGDTPFVTEVATHIINAGGKRFRPPQPCCAETAPGAHARHSPPCISSPHDRRQKPEKDTYITIL